MLFTYFFNKKCSQWILHNWMTAVFDSLLPVILLSENSGVQNYHWESVGLGMLSFILTLTADTDCPLSSNLIKQKKKKSIKYKQNPPQPSHIPKLGEGQILYAFKSLIIVNIRQVSRHVSQKSKTPHQANKEARKFSSWKPACSINLVVWFGVFCWLDVFNSHHFNDKYQRIIFVCD